MVSGSEATEQAEPAFHCTQYTNLEKPFVSRQVLLDHPWTCFSYIGHHFSLSLLHLIPQKRCIACIVAALVLVGSVGTSVASGETLHRLWYDEPVVKWVEALPLGNGRMGAMVFGSVDEARFQLNELVEGPGGHLVVAPSTSPETGYYHPNAGNVRITYGSTYHNTLTRATLEATQQAARILGTDAELRDRIKSTIDRLPPFQIGENGTIQEWIKDYKETDPGHRHYSHLLGVHPFNLITPKHTDLYEAAKKTIDRRVKHGGGSRGWSRAWLINFFARFAEEKQAHKHSLELLRKSMLPNLFNTYSRFQIDGNFGFTGGIAEMLLQSHLGNPIDGYSIKLLPALPQTWDTGSVNGLNARGGLTVDMVWSEGTLDNAVLHAELPVTTNVRYKNNRTTISLNAEESISLNSALQQE